MARSIGIAVIAVVIAVFVLGKDRILNKLRGAASSRVNAAVDKVTGKANPDKPAGDKPAGDKPAGDKPAGDKPAGDKPGTMTLPGVRKALKTTFLGERDETPAPEPPAGDLEKVSYPAPLGNNVAYITPVKPGAKRPAIVWIHGGFGWGIDDLAWSPAQRDNDQTAAAFRKAGIAEMYPALRGGSGNPGKPECFLGEVDDVLAAADFLATRPDVDPKRIYLGGHSTGGLMVLLAAESTPRFRTVFAFGPVGEPRHYGTSSCLPRDAPPAEVRARSAMEFLHEIVTPTFIIEGEQGNAGVFPLLQKRVGSAPVRFVTIPGATHFNGLAPAYDVLARAILADTGDKPAIHITAEAITAAMKGG